MYEVDEEEEVNHWENKPNNYGVRTVHNKDSLQKDRSKDKGVFEWYLGGFPFYPLNFRYPSKFPDILFDFLVSISATKFW